MLARKSETRGGADDDCYVGVALDLYATDLEVSRINDFYRTRLLGDSWLLDYEGPGGVATVISSLQMTAATGDYKFYLTALQPRQSSAQYYTRDFDRAVIDSAFQQYRVVYQVAITYDEPERRKRCDL